MMLIGLGVWQVERLHWKEALLAQISARIHTAPEVLPTPEDWRLAPDDYEYRHVTATGVFEHEKEVVIFRATGSLRGALDAPGFHVLTPLRLEGGAHVLVNRGFVPQDRRDPATRPQGQTSGVVAVTGLLRAPEARNMFTPADDPARRIWYTRDPVAIATALDVANAAPYVIDADDLPVAGGLPQGGATQIAIPNNHLSYAATWFGLAATLLGVYGAFAWRRLKG